MVLSGFRLRPHFFDCTGDEREMLLSALQAALEARPEILFAYVYGSFSGGGPFQDIDVGVYVTEDQAIATWYAIDLAMDLEKVLKQGCSSGPSNQEGSSGLRTIPVDVRVLNHAPFHFGYHVLRGRLLFSRDEAVRVPWSVSVVSRYLDTKPLRDRALKEAMLSWASIKS